MHDRLRLLVLLIPVCLFAGMIGERTVSHRTRPQFSFSFALPLTGADYQILARSVLTTEGRRGRLRSAGERYLFSPRTRDRA